MSKIVVFDAKVITFGINKEYFLALHWYEIILTCSLLWAPLALLYREWIEQLALSTFEPCELHFGLADPAPRFISSCNWNYKNSLPLRNQGCCSAVTLLLLNRSNQMDTTALGIADTFLELPVNCNNTLCWLTYLGTLWESVLVRVSFLHHSWQDWPHIL